ncbi:MAG: DUF3658 domain-containing protein [Ginsengibacter sp.]
MLHIVFQEQDVIALSKSFELDEGLKGNITEIKDDFSAGPLLNIYETQGIEARKNWWRDVLAGGDYDGSVDNGLVDDAKAVQSVKNNLAENPAETAWIWVAANKHDVCGYYWLVSQLKDFEGRVQVLWLNNLPFINEKGHIFYPENLFEIPAKEFLKAQKLARTVSSSEFEIDPDEWDKICNENKMVRTLEGYKKLLQHDADYYDADLLKFITPDWQKAGKVIHHFLSKSGKSTGDAYLLWRIKKLIQVGAIDAQGELKNMKDFEVKLKA